MSPDEQSIHDAIQNLSRKEHVITPEARRAKQELDLAKAEGRLPGDRPDVGTRAAATIEEFNKSVRLLTSIFEESNFDELALFVSRPGRVLLVNFFIGILRGVGFCVGIILVLFLLGYFLPVREFLSVFQ